MQGETFDLVAEAIQYGEPLIGEASATFYWQTPDMEASSWYAQPAQWDADAATASVTWTPKMDVGSSAYRFFFCVSSEAGKNYRLYGTIRLKPSPGIAPAALVPEDIRDELADQIAADVKAWADTRYLKLTGGTVTGPITSRLSSASVPGLTVTLGNDDRYYAKHTQAGIQARREVNAPEEFYAFFDISGGDKIARLKDLGSFLTAESDPTVPAWAKASSKPAYAWAEILNRPTTWAWEAITGKPETFPPAEHEHSQYLTSYTEADPTVPAWAKAPQKPAYTAAEVGAAQASHTHTIGQVTALQSALDNKAPFYSVSVTTNAVTYVWIWDEEEGTFALAPTE